MKSICTISPLFALLLQLSACGSEQPDASSPEFQVGAGGIACGNLDPACVLGNVGHETLTLMGIRRANALLSAAGHGAVFPAQGQVGESGAVSNNPIVRGNYATDKPTLVDEFDIRDFQSIIFHVDPAQDWHEGGQRQVFHSLRNYALDTKTLKIEGSESYAIDSAKQACQALSKLLHETSRTALSMRTGSLPRWDYLNIIGSATHTIQDSYSQAHTQRNDRGDLTDICKFGDNEVAGVCFHEVSEAVVGHDRIFERRGLSMVAVLKQEAESAINATAAYLIHLGRVITSNADLSTEIDDFLAGSQKLRSLPEYQLLGAHGTFTCDQTKDHPL